MAVINTLSQLGTSMKIGYSADYMEAAQNSNVPLLSKFDTLKKVFQHGKSFDWEFNLQTAQNIGTPADGGSEPTIKASVSAAGSVVATQWVGNFDITLLAQAVGDVQGTQGAQGDIVKRKIKETINDVTKHMNRIYAGTHGTGRLAQVNAATTTVATFVCKLPVGNILLRPNMLIDVYTADSGGSVRDSLTAIRISKIANATRTVTLATGTYTLVADDHVYLSGSYGNAANGLRGIVDDGTNLTSLHGVSRSTYEEMKSVVLSKSGVLRNVTEDLLVDLAHGVRQRSGQNINLLAMNFGQLAKLFSHVRADRRLNVQGGEVPKYNTGYKSLPSFFFGGQNVEILASEDVFPREIYGLTTSQIKRVQAAKLDWLQFGGGPEGIFHQSLVAGAPSLGWQACAWGAENLATYLPAAHGVIQDLYDAELCGSSVGGTDT